ncbi:MAG TPA: butyrate kinase [Thermoanaerobaculaceae bacterium]|mgnify:CR=1 FL=1|nr:butyrate kinase [Thermoanaerobaculaceae bacterium]HPS79124.1 butyrate kinase [Thermoanaerobaculaceae bacterium]
MYDIEGSLDRQILATGRTRPACLFTEALDPRVVEAACFLTRFVRPVLLARQEEVREVVDRELPHLDRDRVEYTLSESSFVDIPARADLVDQFAQEYIACARKGGRVVAIEEARRWVCEPARFGIMAARLEHADMVVGGAIHEPKDYFRLMIRFLAREGVCCEAGVFVLPEEHPEEVFPHNIVVFGDVGVNATMTPDVLAYNAVETCAVARDLIPDDVLPEVHGAIVSYSNRGSDEGPSPELVRRAVELVPEYLTARVRQNPRYGSIRIQGEVKVSVALSQRSAMYYQRHKNMPWEGSPNVIICPNLDMGNLLYHLYGTRFPTARKFPVMAGLGSRGVDLAMDSSPEDIRLAVKASVLRLHIQGPRRLMKDTFFRRFMVLAVNPGSTSTKISVYEGEEERFTKELQHSAQELLPFEGRPLTEQFGFRKDVILQALAENDLSMDDIDAVSGRGGVLHPVPHGTMAVNDAMVSDLRAARYGEHASNLGGLIAHELVAGTGKPSFIVDPVVVDEVAERVRITGLKEIRRRVVSHALNQIATARRFAEENETFYEKINVIVCHMGGGITIGAHKRGTYIDVNNGLDGEGPFTPQRSGSLPVGDLIDLCFSGKYTRAELKKLNKGRGGLIDLLGTSDLREVERRMQAGDAEAAAVFDALAYQISKWICILLPAFDGQAVDRILLTGGMARSRLLVEAITRYVAAVGCGVCVYPGENEMFALVKGALRVLSGKEPVRQYEREQ